MHAHRDSWLTKIPLGLFFLAVIAYAYFELRGLLYGPHITVTSSISTSHDEYVLISGATDHIASLSVDGAPVSVTTNGAFEVPYLLAPGLNKITLDARDSYGHTTSQVVEIVYITPEATSSSLSASSTPFDLPPMNDRSAAHTPTTTPTIATSSATSSSRVPRH